MSSTPTEHDIEALLSQFKDSDWEEIHLSLPDFELYVSKTATSLHPAATPVRERAAENARPPAVTPPAKAEVPDKTAEEEILPDEWVVIKAPNLGTFYSAPKPGAAPYVTVGDQVTPETEVCLIEVMKLFTALPAGVSGTIKKICARDGDMIEGGQELFWVEAD